MGSALLKSIISDYSKSLISRINDVDVCFSIQYRYSDILLKKKNKQTYASFNPFNPLVLLQPHLLLC